MKSFSIFQQEGFSCEDFSRGTVKNYIPTATFEINSFEIDHKGL